MPDAPLHLSRENDLLDTMSYVHQLKELIKNTASPQSAFAIGLVSPWGYGKTTFLGYLKSQFSNDDNIVMGFDVWKCKTASVVINNFFDLLREKLSPHSFSISRLIKDYTYLLMKHSEHGFVKSLTGIFFRSRNIEEAYENINREIRKINKRVIITIDDVDRLDKEEIFEVVRLIRNTGSFSNTFFIVAYDKNYLLNAISHINAYNPNLSLEKIFQLEFALPALDDQQLMEYLVLQLKHFLTPQSQKDLEEFRKREFTFGNIKTDLTSIFIRNVRDVKRFINTFKVDYAFLKDEVFFQDFYNLELIKFKYPEIYMEFYRNRTLLLNTEAKANVHPKIFTHRLARYDDHQSKSHHLVLRQFLSQNQSTFLIDEKDVKIITDSFAKIFKEPDTDLSYESKSFFSVIVPSMFDRYFRVNVRGRLSNVDFTKARKGPLPAFLHKISEWSEDFTLKNEVALFLEEISDYDDRVDFENIITALFYLGSIGVAINVRNLYEKLLDYQGAIVSKYYDGDPKSFSNFLVKILTESPFPYLFESNFLKYIKETTIEQVPFPLSLDFVNKQSQTYFELYCQQAEKVDFVFWRHFLNSRNVEISQMGHSISRTYNFTGEAKQTFKSFITEKDLDGFLESVIKVDPFESSLASLSGEIPTFFESWKLFENFIYSQSPTKSRYLTEFKELYTAFKATNFEKPVTFVFKNIPLKT